MPTKDIFSRPVRMISKYGSLERRQDPLGVDTFEMPWPKRVDDLSKKCPGGTRTNQDYGVTNYRPDPSPICKPNGGFASTDGPAPDRAQELAMPLPVGTKRRLGPLKTDK
jgi:hypothetical protein